MSASRPENLDFSNTEIAFHSKSNYDLRNSYFLFKLIGINALVKIGPFLAETALSLHLPVKGLIKQTIFKQFCGGESIEDCAKTIDNLASGNVGTILDYSVEGKEREADFDHTAEETVQTIKRAENNPKIPFSVFKVTGLARFALLEKINNKITLADDEEKELTAIKNRVERICKTAYEANVRIFIDAEETWIQDAIDSFAYEMMERFNSSTAIVYNTIQFYRADSVIKLHEAHELAKKKGYKLGLKLVRGAYMEKERKRAAEMSYPSPINPDKAASDKCYDAALDYCMEHINDISICAGTHNEDSSAKLVKLMQTKGIAPDDKRIFFSQLLGMSDHISFNLANAGYNVAKYVPYGPVRSVMPYLTRRAQENTSVSGQMGRELQLVSRELQRRKKAGK